VIFSAFVFPVTAELSFAAQATLVFRQLCGVFAESIDRLEHCDIEYALKRVFYASRRTSDPSGLV
jgi:hypothetical protein